VERKPEGKNVNKRFFTLRKGTSDLREWTTHPSELTAASESLTKTGKNRRRKKEGKIGDIHYRGGAPRVVIKGGGVRQRKVI